MVKRSHGIRACTRSILRKHPRERGMPPITHSLQKFEIGEKASIVINPSVHSGQPHRRFQGQTGIIVGSQGGSYLLEIVDGNKTKKILSSPEHLRKQQ